MSRIGRPSASTRIPRYRNEPRRPQYVHMPGHAFRPESSRYRIPLAIAAERQDSIPSPTLPRGRFPATPVHAIPGVPAFPVWLNRAIAVQAPARRYPLPVGPQ